MAVLLIICTAATPIVFGYFIMKKLDIFLDNNRRGLPDFSGSPALRIAFETPAWIASVSDLLERFSKENPKCEIWLFYGTKNEIKEGVEKENIDIGFVADVWDMENEKYVSELFPIRQNTITSDAVGLPVAPLGETEITAKAIWKKNGNRDYRDIFVKKLNLFTQG